MSLQAYEWAWKMPVTNAEKLVLLAVAEFANSEGECYPPNEAIMEMTGLSERAVKGARSSLVKGGYIQKTKGKKIVLPLSFRPAKSAESAPKRANIAPKKVQNLHPESAKSAPKSAESAPPSKPSSNRIATTPQSPPEKNPVDALYAKLGPLAFEAAGFDNARDRCGWGIVRQWVADAFRAGLNAEQAELVILHTLRAEAGPARERVGSIFSLKFFSQSIQRAITSGKMPEVPLTPEQRKARIRAKIRYQEADKAYSRAFLSNPSGNHPPAPRFADFIAQAELEMAQGAVA